MGKHGVYSICDDKTCILSKNAYGSELHFYLKKSYILLKIIPKDIGVLLLSSNALGKKEIAMESI